MKKSITRNQVAELAGVSSATVSRVYNCPELVTEENRRKVILAANKLGYYPNKTASSLRRSGTGQIALAELKKEKRGYYWNELPVFKWFYADVLHAVKNEIDKTMFQLTIESISGPGDLKKLSSRCDGLICFDVDLPDEAEMIAQSGIPYVIGHHTRGFEGYTRCSTDNFAGGVLQAEILKRRGCIRPAYVTGNLDTVPAHGERLRGFLSAYPEGTVRVLDFGTGMDAGKKAADAAYGDIRTGNIDGLAAVNDLTAVGTGYRLAEYGIHMDRDLPAAGYDNMPFRSVLPFLLDSVDMRPSEIYRTAARMLIDRIRGNSSAEEEAAVVEPVQANPAARPK